MREARRADLALVWLVGAVRDQIDAELALRGLDGRINLTGRNVVALGVKLEVMNQAFHRTLHLAPSRRHDLVVVDGDRTFSRGRAQLFQTLFHDPRRLTHFFHADQITVEAVAVLSDRNVEVE